MRVGIQITIDNLGRIVIPKGYREFYHMDKNDKVCLIDTPDGLLLTNPKYKMVEIKQDDR